MKIHRLILCCSAILGLSGCNSFLDLSPKDKVSEDVIYSSEEGILMELANLYYFLPIEDYGWSPARGFHCQTGNNGGLIAAMSTDEAVHSEFADWDGVERFDYWDAGYRQIRKINSFLKSVPTINVAGVNNTELEGELYFLRAYTYFALVKRYGGVPLIDKYQEYTDDFESLKVPRSTEKDSWDFILNDLEEAYNRLPDNIDSRRANRWTALALKSRAALYAASIAKNPLNLVGEAVDLKLVGIDPEYADTYYQQCMDAAKRVIASGKFGLYKPTPADADEAATNFQALFEDPNQAATGLPEAMFIKGYTFATPLVQDFDYWFRPNQVANGVPHPGRFNPVLDLVDMFEDYTDDGSGKSAPVSTREDGDENNYGGFDKNVDYKEYPSLMKIFENKDARLRASIILPGSTWKGKKIIIQGGFIRPDGTSVFRTDDSYELNGVTYYSFGAESRTDYSGFSTVGGNYTRSGFLLKKFLQEKKDVDPDGSKGENDWTDIRYAEVLLNYAEAAAEATNATGEQKSDGKEALNAVRHRAAHKDDIQLTVENVRKERAVEFAFENKRFWDLYRWRTYHKDFENRKVKALVPFIDLRTEPVSYIFVRMDVPGSYSHTFVSENYYRQIPGIADNGLIQNP